MFSKLRRRKSRNEPNRLDSLRALPLPAEDASTSTGPRNQTSCQCQCCVATDAPDPIRIVSRDSIFSAAFLADGQHVVSAGSNGKIRQWRVEDGMEVGKPKDISKGSILDLETTQDGRWIVYMTFTGQVTALDTISHEKANGFGTRSPVNAFSLSTDGTKIATGSSGYDSLSIWSFPAGRRLLGPFERNGLLLAVKFSPDGRYIATGPYVNIYDSSGGRILADFDFPTMIGSSDNRSLAWASDSSRLFALFEHGDIHCYDMSTKKTSAKWRIHSENDPTCIAVTCNDAIIVASAGSSLSLWDTNTHQQIGTVIYYHYFVESMAISPSYDIVTAGDRDITLQNLCDILPSSYSKKPLQILSERKIDRLKVENSSLENTIQSLHDDITNLEETVQELRSQLAASNKEKKDLDEAFKSLCGQNETLNRKMTHLDESGKELRNAFVASQGPLDRMTQTIRALRADVDLPEQSSVSIGQKVNGLEVSAHELNSQFATCNRALRVYDREYECETLYANGRIYDAAQHIANMTTESISINTIRIRAACVSRLQEIGDEASSSKDHDEALSAYSAILILTPSPPEGVLMGWARMALRHRSLSETLGTAKKFKHEKFHVYQAICTVLQEECRFVEVIKCVRVIQSELLSEETNSLDEKRQWELDVLQRCSEMLEKGGDVAMNLKDHDAAIASYSNALSLHSRNISSIIVKCCKARVGLLEDELLKVTQFIERDPSNYKAYKRRHAILHSLARYNEAFDAFEMMLSKMEHSFDPKVRNMQRCYLNSTPLIRQVIDQTIHDMPRVLINTATGRLHDKVMQAEVFEQHPIFNELRSFMTTRNRLDLVRIRREVEMFYRYVMFSHRWQPPEPSFLMVENTVIYELPISPTISKLINFCKLVQSRGFRWAWSDTCCVDQSDRGVQQESVVAMFQWYSRAALTIVHLLGVLSESQEPGLLRDSIWNTRGWTYQEYVASRVVQFYTEDWKPYLGLEIFNHKESPIIIAEMEQANSFTSQALATLQPGLTRVREKLYLASKRQTTRKEDIAYCLFGIFDVALPVIYGEGTRAIRRLLEHILTQSDNVTLLSWTQAGSASSGGTNSYLPSDLTVYDQIDPPYVPRPVETAEMDRMIMRLQSSLLNPSLAVQLYRQLYDSPPLSIATGRLRLPGFVFRLTSLTKIIMEPGSDSIALYHATATILGDVYIETKEDLVGMHGLVLIHPWISPLLDRDLSGGAPQFDLAMRALRLVVRLKQPFGALLLSSQGRALYKHVATDSFIEVQMRAETALNELIDSVKIVDVQ